MELVGKPAGGPKNEATSIATIHKALDSGIEWIDTALAERPEIVVVTKSELPDAATVAELLAEQIDRPVMQISAVSGQGLPELTNAIFEILAEADEE